MNNVKEFIETRQQIEFLANETAVLVDQKSMPKSRAKLNEATGLLTTLTAMADNDVQEVVVARLTRLLGKLEVRVAKLAIPAKARKKS